MDDIVNGNRSEEEKEDSYRSNRQDSTENKRSTLDYSRRSRSRSPTRHRYSRSPPRRNRSRDSMDEDRYQRSSRYRDDGPRWGGGRGGRGGRDEGHRRAINREVAAQEAAKRSQKDCRVYVGNLAFSVRWNDLKDFMREAGHVVFAEIMQLPNGMSKGCGVVEYSNPDEAQRAINELNDRTLMGRALFIREDREETARYGNSATGGGRGGDYESYGRYGGAFGLPKSGAFAPSTRSKQIYVGGLNELVGWQDLKDLFRQAGDVVRADVNTDEDGHAKGSGTVLFGSAGDASAAIHMFNGVEINGMMLDVREDVAGSAAASFGRGGRGPPPSKFDNLPPSRQIFVKNLPWTTSNEDLVDLFQTTGTVENTEILYEGARSKGAGIVQFSTTEEAETAIAKLKSYVYGGRPLHLTYNAKWHDFENSPDDAMD